MTITATTANGNSPHDPLDSGRCLDPTRTAPAICADRWTADYDPTDDLNALFAHPAALAAVAPVARALAGQRAALDRDVAARTAAQAASDAGSLARIAAARAELVALFAGIDAVRARARRTEQAIAAMTADIKRLDATKRNLTLSMTVLKRLQMLSMSLLSGQGLGKGLAGCARAAHGLRKMDKGKRLT